MLFFALFMVFCRCGSLSPSARLSSSHSVSLEMCAHTSCSVQFIATPAPQHRHSYISATHTSQPLGFARVIENLEEERKAVLIKRQVIYSTLSPLCQLDRRYQEAVVVLNLCNTTAKSQKMSHVSTVLQNIWCYTGRNPPKSPPLDYQG